MTLTTTTTTASSSSSSTTTTTTTTRCPGPQPTLKPALTLPVSPPWVLVTPPGEQQRPLSKRAQAWGLFVVFIKPCVAESRCKVWRGLELSSLKHYADRRIGGPPGEGIELRQGCPRSSSIYHERPEPCAVESTTDERSCCGGEGACSDPTKIASCQRSLRSHR